MGRAFEKCDGPDANGKCPEGCTPVLDPLTGKVTMCVKSPNVIDVIGDTVAAMAKPILVFVVVLAVAGALEGRRK